MNCSEPGAKPVARPRTSHGIEQLAGDDHGRQRQRQDGQGLAGEAQRRRAAARGAQAGEQRHEGGAEGAFGEQAAQEVGELEADEERVGHRPGAQGRGDQQVAPEAGDARQGRESADGQRGAADAHATASTSASCFCTRCILLRWMIFRPNTSLT